MTASGPPSPEKSLLSHYLDAYMATGVAALGMAALLFLVPQTAAILSQTSLTGEFSVDPWGTLARLAAVQAVLFFFLLLFAVVFPPDPALDHLRPRNRVGAGVLKLVDRFHARAQGSSERMAGLFLRFLNRLSPITRNAIGAGALVLGVVGTYAIGPAGLAAQPGRADSASVWPGVLLAGAGLWVLLLPPTHGGYANRVSWPWRVSFRAILMVACAWALGQALWLLPFFTDGAVDTGPYCLWGVGFLIFLSAVAGRIVDAADIRSPLPLKVIAASVLVIFFGVTGNDSLDASSGGVAAAADQGVGDRWYDAMLQRIEAMPGKGPVVLVAASGGGSRAALFAALAYEAMESLPLDPTDPRSATVGSHIVAISSVSGGSLASAWYQHARKDGEPLPRLHTRGLGRWPVLTATMQEEAKRLALKAEARFGRSPASALFASVNAQVSQLPGTPLPDAPWLESSQFVSDMGENFMAAVLRAVVEPGMSRGESITRLWTSEFGLGELNNAPGIVPGVGPAVLFNATEVESGRRFVIGFPRLPPELLGNTMGSMDDAAGSLWVNGAQAARLSANFPWGFDVVSLPGVNGRAAVDLLDGGIVDNTGMDSFAALFERLAASESPKAVALLAAMRERGVLLVEIDAGARPSETSGLAAMMPGLTRPLRALEAAGAVSADAARDGNVGRIARVVQEGQERRRFVHLTWVCNRLDNVRTAWSLGSRDQAVTILQFLAENRRLPPLFQAAHLVLTGQEGAVDLQARIEETELAAREFNLGVLSDPSVAPEALSGAEGRLRAPKPLRTRNFSATGWAAAPETTLAGEDSGEDTQDQPPPDEPQKKKKKKKNATRKRPATR